MFGGRDVMAEPGDMAWHGELRGGGGERRGGRGEGCGIVLNASSSTGPSGFWWRKGEGEVDLLIEWDAIK